MPWSRSGLVHIQFDGSGRAVTRVQKKSTRRWSREIRDGDGSWVDDGAYRNIDEAKAGPVAERRQSRNKVLISIRRARQLHPDVMTGGGWTRQEMGCIARRSP